MDLSHEPEERGCGAARGVRQVGASTGGRVGGRQRLPVEGMGGTPHPEPRVTMRARRLGLWARESKTKGWKSLE